MGMDQRQLPALITPTFAQGLGSTRRAPAEPHLWKLAPAAGWAPTCLGSFCFRSKSEDAPFSQRPCTTTLPPVYLPAVNDAFYPNRGLFVKLGHKSALFRTNYNVWF